MKKEAAPYFLLYSSSNLLNVEAIVSSEDAWYVDKYDETLADILMLNTQNRVI